MIHSKKKTQLVYLYYVYKHKKNASRPDIKNYDEKAYKYVPTYGYESTGYHRHMISVFFFYSNTLKSMLVDCAVADMGYFYDYPDAVPRAKTMRGNFITTFILHISQCITFFQTNLVKATMIAEALLKSFY